MHLQAVHAGHLGEVGTQLLVMMPLAYMCAANYYSIFKLGMFSFYLLVPHATQPASLLLNASLVCRFITPLCYNFLHVIRMHVPEANGQVLQAPAQAPMYLPGESCLGIFICDVVILLMALQPPSKMQHIACSLLWAIQLAKQSVTRDQGTVQGLNGVFFTLAFSCNCAC